MTARLFSIVVFFHALIAGCGPGRSGRGEMVDATTRYEVISLGKISKGEVRESSGLVCANAAGTEFWTHGDGGAPNVLYRVGDTGELLQTLLVAGASNRDWEDLGQDAQGRLYIGDCGNNNNDRRNLAIYRFNPAHPGQPADTIRFRYPDQVAFPPRKSARNFDCEALYFAHDSLFLFTKNRSKGGLWTKQYAVPNQPGTHVATRRDSLELETWVTGASVSPDGRTIALLGYGFIYLFEGEPSQAVFDRRRSRVRVASSGQSEAITFSTNSDLVFSNENGKLFALKKK
ncbi:MAG: hypothetical protein H7330_10985 [Hymenobacteraceae bacterium]|nr:hypothetical protein [Hymenobacteraceae bacterium]